MKDAIIFALDCESPYREYHGLRNMFQYKGYDPDLLERGHGRYKKDGSLSYIYMYPNLTGVYDIVQGLCLFHKQDQVLLVDHPGDVYLKHVESGDTECIGKVMEVDDLPLETSDYISFHNRTYKLGA